MNVYQTQQSLGSDIFNCKTSSMLSYCYCPCTWWGAQTSTGYDLYICLGLESFPGCWLRLWPNTISADPEQIAEEPSHRTPQNTVFCWTKCKGGICLYVDSNCPQLHFPTVWRTSKRGLLTITCHMLDVFCVLKHSFKHLFKDWKYKISKFSKRSLEAWIGFIRNMQMWSNIIF